MSKTIEEIKKSKVDIESKILDILKAFEEENDVRVNYIDTQRQRPHSTKDGYHPCHCMPEEHYMDLPLNNVEITLRFDI